MSAEWEFTPEEWQELFDIQEGQPPSESSILNGVCGPQVKDKVFFRMLRDVRKTLKELKREFHAHTVSCESRHSAQEIDIARLKERSIGDKLLTNGAWFLVGCFVTGTIGGLLYKVFG